MKNAKEFQTIPTNLIFEMGYETMIPKLSFDKPSKVALDWNEWKVKRKPGIRTLIWNSDRKSNSLSKQCLFRIIIFV